MPSFADVKVIKVQTVLVNIDGGGRGVFKECPVIFLIIFGTDCLKFGGN